MLQRLHIGDCVIANGASVGSIVGNAQLSGMKGFCAYVPALTQASVHFEVGPDADSESAEMTDLYIDTTQATSGPARVSWFNTGGFRSIRAVSAGNEGAERTIPLYAIVDV